MTATNRKITELVVEEVDRIYAKRFQNEPQTQMEESFVFTLQLGKNAAPTGVEAAPQDALRRL